MIVNTRLNVYLKIFVNKMFNVSKTLQKVIVNGAINVFQVVSFKLESNNIEKMFC